MSHRKTPLNCKDGWCVPRVQFSPIKNVSFKDLIGKDSFAIDDEETVRNYKIGLRVPESLLDAQNSLIKEREILQHLKKELRGNVSKFSKNTPIYREYLKKYRRVSTLQEVAIATPTQPK